MKNLSLALNAVLLIAVAVLYYLHFSAPQTVSDNSDGPIAPDSVMNSKDLANTVKVSSKQEEAIIVYVNIDTLFEHYKLYQKVNKEVEGYIAAMENNFKNKVMKYQQDLEEYMDKAGKGLIPKEQAEQTEKQLMDRKMQIENEERNMAALQAAQSKKLEVVQKKLYDFFKEFTAKHNYSCVLTYTARGEGALGIRDELDVTNQVLDALNTDYENSLKNQPTKPSK